MITIMGKRKALNSAGGLVCILLHYRSTALKLCSSFFCAIAFLLLSSAVHAAPVTTATPLGGLYNAGKTVNLSSDGVTIYYTTDGTEPTTGSATYSAPINIPSTTTLKFFTEDGVGDQEAVKTEVYTIDTTPPR